MIEYIKNAKAYKLQNRQISSRCGPGHMTQFWRVINIFSANLGPKSATNSWKRNSEIAQHSRDICIEAYIKNQFFELGEFLVLQKKVMFHWPHMLYETTHVLNS